MGRLRAFVRAVLCSLRRRDLPLHAAAVTFYGGVAVVPVALLTVRLAGLLAGATWVREVTAPVVAALPDRLGAARGAAVLINAGLTMSPILSLTALLPATWYGEGLRRAFVSLADPSRPPAGWRGRLVTLPLLAVGPALLLGVLTVLPSAARLLGRGGWSSVGAVVVSFLTVWVAFSPVLTWLYRVIGPGRPSWLAAAVGGSFTAANISGFAHGFVLFWSLPLDLGLPFGGLDLIGAVVAVALWLYLFHAIALLGYAATLSIQRPTELAGPSQSAELAGPSQSAELAGPSQSAEPTDGSTVDSAARGLAGSEGG